MIVYYLFVHKKSVWKWKVCFIFIKNKKFKKTQKNPQKNIVVGFFGWVFLGFLGGFFNANPALIGASSEKIMYRYTLDSFSGFLHLSEK